MKKQALSAKPVGIVLAALVGAAGIWLYAQRVLIPYQVADAAAHNRPRGNLSDLYPRWLGARELLLHGRDPYSAEVTREIQTGYFGRPLDASRSGDPRDQAGFAYPVYVVFFLAPTVELPFPVIGKCFFWLLVILTAASAIVWLRVVQWPLPIWAQCSLILLILGSFAGMQGLKLEQITLFVVALIAASIALLMADQGVMAGILLAVCSIKPQLVFLLLAWLAIWTVGDWRKRYRWLISYLLSMAILCTAGEWYLPGWIARFWHAVREYQKYTGSASVMTALIGPWSKLFELLAVIALATACWRERRNTANSAAFAFMVSMVLAVTILVEPTSAQYNQVLLIPAVILLVKERKAIWRRSAIQRVLFAMTMVLIVWPWTSSAILALLSFLLPPQIVERSWTVPLWTTTQIPVGVAALMLFHYYQETLGASSKASTS